MSHHTAEHRSRAMNECIDNCTRCHAICLETINYCLGRGGGHAEAQHITLLIGCADMCRTCADAMLLGSSANATTCATCADICRKCAESCERLADSEMERCVRMCRQCADSCEAMASA